MMIHDCKLFSCAQIIKACSKCKKSSLMSAFYSNISRPDGHNVYCKACVKLSAKKQKSKNIGHNCIISECNTQEQFCLWHNESHFLTEFRPAPAYKSSHEAVCRVAYIEKSYNMEQGAWKKLWNLQNGKCALCKQNFLASDINLKPVVDHCHDTSVVRALLHNSCNMAIGRFGDDFKLCYQAYQYLEKHSRQKKKERSVQI